MPFIAPTTPTKKLLEPWKYDATLYWIIDCGTQEVTYEWETKQQRKVLFLFELHDEKVTYKDKDTDQEVTWPKIKSKIYTLSMNERSSLYKDINGRTGKPPAENFDLLSLINKKCELKIIQKEGKNWVMYENIASIDMSNHTKEKENESITFQLDNFNQEDFENLYDRIQDMIKKSPEYKKAQDQQEKEEDFWDLPM